MTKQKEYAKAILKRDSEDDDHSTDDICDLAKELSKLILKESKADNIQYCDDCKGMSVFEINECQEPKYYNGVRLRECIKCGRYEEVQ